MSTLNDDRLQRDWLGHGIQVVILLVTIGIPLAYWAIATNASVAQIVVRQERQDKDIDRQSQAQTLVTGQLLDVSKTLTRIDTQLEMLREQNKPKR